MVVAPITGNSPAIIPMVTEKASFSAVNPSSGINRNGISILFLRWWIIFKVLKSQQKLEEEIGLKPL